MFGGRVIFLRRSSTAPLADSMISWRECISLCVRICMRTRVQVQENKLTHVREMVHLRIFYERDVKKKKLKRIKREAFAFVFYVSFS